MNCKSKIDNFLCMDIIEKATKMEKEGESIIHFEKGELDFNTPQIIIDEAIDILRNKKSKYTVSSGLMELKEAICYYYSKKYSVTINTDQIFINAGSSPALLTLFLALFDEGDEIILSNPCYSGYPKFIEIVKAEPIFINIESSGFSYKADAVENYITSQTKAILINSPSNPIGAVLDKEELKKFSGLGPLIISDEVYHGISYGDDRDYSILEFTDNAVVANSFSKLYSMTGWRLGYIIVPERFISAIKSLQQNFFVSPNFFVQWAAIVALKNELPEIELHKYELNKRKNYLCNEIVKLGLEIPYHPQGAFYIFAKIKDYCDNSIEFSKNLLDKYKVAVTPGIDFGSDGEGYIRMSYSLSLEDIDEGIKRLRSYLSEFQRRN